MLWDIFDAARLEVVRGLSTEQVRAALAAGGLGADDLIRPAGSSEPWARLGEHPVGLDSAPEATLATPAPPPEPEPGPGPSPEPPAAPDLGPYDLSLDDGPESLVALPVPADPSGPRRAEAEGATIEAPPPVPAAALPRSAARASWAEPDAMEDEDEAIAAFTLSRGGPETIEELDLAAMVDVAFQLVLFFLVTATTVLYKTLEIPKPRPEQPPAAAAQGAAAPKPVEDLAADYIIVAIDPQGRTTIDQEPVAADFDAIVARLRRARADTGRTAMLLSADPATLHRQAVVAYDAANEIGLRIAIARPAKAGGPS
jgi:biopolymer transport protein ExbD